VKVPAVSAFVLTLFAATVADARSTQPVPYPAPDIWATSIRFLRVDRGFPIREKDESAGYILFDYLDSGRSYRGALELIPAADVDGRVGAQVVVSIPDLPRRYETGLLDRLAAKIRDERGPPAPRGKAPDAAPPKPTPGGSIKGGGTKGDSTKGDATKDDASDKTAAPEKSKGRSGSTGGGLPRMPEAVTP